MALLGSRRKTKGEKNALDPTSENIGFLDSGENAFRDSVDEGHRVDRRAQKVFIMCVALAALYAVGLVFPKELFNIGYVNSLPTVDGGYTLSTFIREFQENVQSVVMTLTGDNPRGFATLWRYIVVVLAGMGLAVSGAVYQGAFRNALVSPSTLGVMTGGQTGMLVWILVIATSGATARPLTTVAMANDNGTEGWFDYFNTSLGLSLTSFVGCVVVIALVLLVFKAAGVQRASGIAMIITGQVVAGVCGVFGTLVRYYYTTTDPWGTVAELLQLVQVASFYRTYTLFDVGAVFVVLLITFVVVMRLSQRMMLLSLDEAEQRSLGVDSRKMQVVVVGLCTFLTAVVISFCGSVGFVGFMVPHMARRMVGPNFRYLLPASCVLGGLFVLGAYTLMEVLFGPDYATVTGMFISIGGAVVFLATVLRGKGVQYGAFR